jgi:pimeloyl-ACP methyl ester carboxylesterase
MASFVLVHGAWHGGWCWQRVAAVLRRAGHDVFHPTLTGVGDRSHLIGTRPDLSTHIKDTTNLIAWEDLQDVVLCGHSYGGMVVTGAADAMADRIAALVHLDSYIPRDGQCMMEFVPEPRRSSIAHDGASTGSVPPPSVDLLKINAADRAWVAGKLTPHPYASLIEPIRLTGAWQTVKRRTYVYSAGATMSAPFYAALRHDPTWQVQVMDAGHDQMIDAPQDVAEILARSA